jgi:nitronate monooxygenase
VKVMQVHGDFYHLRACSSMIFLPRFQAMLNTIETDFTRILNIRYPIIGAPMFLVSNVEMVVAVSEAGGIGAFPSLNYRSSELFAQALKEIRQRTQKPMGVNIIVNKSNTRQDPDLKMALDSGVELFITSLGNPKTVINEAHKIGSKVFCDVTNLEFALKVQDLGADGVIAVGSGAGGHAGPISPLVLVPWLKEKLKIPVVAAGGIAHGRQVAACLSLGASAVSIGTRFIASLEAHVDEAYKKAIVEASPEDIMLTSRISGTPAAVIKTPYTEKMGAELPWLVRLLKSNPATKNITVPLIHWLGMKKLEAAAITPTWKTVWSAGQSAGLVHEISSCQKIMKNLVREYEETVLSLPH